MKRSAFLVLACFFLFGCGQLARESEFWDHSSMYQDWGHLYFSMGGYRNCDAGDALDSKRNGWWGITMPCGSEVTAAPLIQGQKPKDAPKEETVAPAEKIEKVDKIDQADKKETPVKKKKKKSKKKVTKSKSKKITNKQLQ